MDKRSRLAVLLLIAVILIGARVIIYIEIERNRGPYMVLQGPLPADRPEMRIVTIIPIGFGNTIDAREYASMYYPEFADVEFSESDLGYFYAEKNESSICVYSSGKIVCTPRDGPEDVPINSFPFEMAANISEGFIEAHGGMGPYEEYERYTSGSVDDDGNFLSIKARSFDYHRRYDGYWVLGDDWLGTMVFAGTSDVTFCRAASVLNATNETRQVISAHAAWDSFFESMGGGNRYDRISVTSVELCYYVEDYPKDGPVIYAAWRFVDSDSDIDYFVDAFTGEVLSGIHRAK
jgi:hypothetical protein